MRGGPRTASRTTLRHNNRTALNDVPTYSLLSISPLAPRPNSTVGKSPQSWRLLARLTLSPRGHCESSSRRSQWSRYDPIVLSKFGYDPVVLKFVRVGDRVEFSEFHGLRPNAHLLVQEPGRVGASTLDMALYRNGLETEYPIVRLHDYHLASDCGKVICTDNERLQLALRPERIEAVSVCRVQLTLESKDDTAHSVTMTMFSGATYTQVFLGLEAADAGQKFFAALARFV